MGISEELKSKFRNEKQKARLNILVTSMYLGEHAQKMMQEFNLSSAQFNILRILRGQETKQLCINEIRSRMIEKNSDVSRIVDRLVNKNLVERKENKEDRRIKDISITKNGLDLLKEMDPQEAAFDDLLDMLSDNEVNQLNIILDKIRTKKNN